MVRSLFRPVLALAALGAFASQGCSGPDRARGGLPSDGLDHAIGDVIGDPSTCVVIADRATGKVVYRYGSQFNCVRGLPACDRPGFLSATSALALASAEGRGASCNSNADGSRLVGWAEGRIVRNGRDLAYSAVMEGQTAMPGHEMSARLDGAFQKAGL